MRKSVVVLATLAVLFISVCTTAQFKDDYWYRIPPEWKGQITTRSYDGISELGIEAFWCTNAAFLAFWGDEAKAHEESDSVMLDLVSKTWPGRAVLFLGVAPYEQGKYYWWPTSLVVTQGSILQHNIAIADLLKVNDAFGSGRLYATAMGFVALPADLDLTKTFRLWYEEQYMVLGPFTKP